MRRIRAPPPRTPPFSAAPGEDLAAASQDRPGGGCSFEQHHAAAAEDRPGGDGPRGQDHASAGEGCVAGGGFRHQVDNAAFHPGPEATPPAVSGIISIQPEDWAGDDIFRQCTVGADDSAADHDIRRRSGRMHFAAVAGMMIPSTSQIVPSCKVPLVNRHSFGFAVVDLHEPAAVDDHIADGGIGPCPERPAVYRRSDDNSPVSALAAARKDGCFLRKSPG
ncbi:MAG: hypothetical protein V8T86_01925 [Victivallis sp.]